MKSNLYRQLLEQNSTVLTSLYNKKVFLIARYSEVTLLQDKNAVELNAVQFSDDDFGVLQSLITSRFLSESTLPAVYDIIKAVQFFKESSLELAQKIEASFLVSRINFMGTDGIRGKVVTSPTEHGLKDFITGATLTPALVELCVFSFVSMLSDKGHIQKGDTIVLGNDGRDSVTGWSLKKAVTEGVVNAGQNLCDIGIVPTGFIPLHMLKKGYQAGIALTASHNPSNQNGVKFFFNGKKLLPESECGDYVLSAYMVYNSLNRPVYKQRGVVHSSDASAKQGEELILSILPNNIQELLKDTILVVDSANGAFHYSSISILNTLAVHYSMVNETPEGKNINKNCGVAEIEGTECFNAGSYSGAIPFIKRIFDAGRHNRGNTVFGISLDGDGDRGFLLLYDAKDDCVHVIDGDRCGYILARYFLKKRPELQKDHYFVSTIESDLMTDVSVKKNLGIASSIVSVGDKWIGNFSEGKLLVGLEPSGHIIFPIDVAADSQKGEKLYTGIGLLTALMTLAAVKELGLSQDEIIHPYEPGFSKTFYVYNVDKAKFSRNSDLWKKDIDFLQQQIKECIQEGVLPSATVLEFINKEDSSVLYANIISVNTLAGCVFVRNSGTENKNAIYVKGEMKYKHVLERIGRNVQHVHITMMKNRNSIEYAYEDIICSVLKQEKESSVASIKNSIESRTKADVNESDLLAVIYGMKKEGRVSLENQMLRLLEPVSA